MKKYFYYLTLVAFLCYSCDEAEELFEEEFDIQSTFITELEVNVPNDVSQDAVDFQSNTGLWDYRNDPNVTEYLGSPDEITKIEINSVRYFYKDVVGNEEANVEGEIVIVIGQGGEEFDTVQTNLMQADDNNTLYTLNGDFSSVNAGLTISNVLALYYSGSVSDNPVSFIIDVSITATITIKPDIDNL